MATFVRFGRSALLISLLLLASIGVPLKVFDSKGLERVDRLQKELYTLKETNTRIKRENTALRNEIRAFHANPGYIEKVARDELGMVGPFEIIYQFPANAPN